MRDSVEAVEQCDTTAWCTSEPSQKKVEAVRVMVALEQSPHARGKVCSWVYDRMRPHQHSFIYKLGVLD